MSAQRALDLRRRTGRILILRWRGLDHLSPNPKPCGEGDISGDAPFMLTPGSGLALLDSPSTTR